MTSLSITSAKTPLLSLSLDVSCGRTFFPACHRRKVEITSFQPHRAHQMDTTCVKGHRATQQASECQQANECVIRPSRAPTIGRVPGRPHRLVLSLALSESMFWPCTTLESAGLIHNAGKDATEDFDEIGHSKSARELLSNYKIGAYKVIIVSSSRDSLHLTPLLFRPPTPAQRRQSVPSCWPLCHLNLG